MKVNNSYKHFAICNKYEVDQATPKSQISDCKIEENNGFLKYVCHHHQDEDDSITKYKCSHSNEFYTLRTSSIQVMFANNICSNDPRFYQACDKRMGSKVTNNEVLCENYLCYIRGRVVTPLGLSTLGRCTTNCENTVLNKEECSEEKIALPTGKLVRPNEVCNDICDVKFTCEDEATCNGYLYGKYCVRYNRIVYVPPKSPCDKYQDDCEDCLVVSSTKSFCRHVSTRHIVPVHDYLRCGPVQMSDYGFYRSGFTYCVLEDIASLIKVTARIHPELQ